jgi:hypothetical protein
MRIKTALLMALLFAYPTILLGQEKSTITSVVAEPELTCAGSRITATVSPEGQVVLSWSGDLGSAGDFGIVVGNSFSSNFPPGVNVVTANADLNQSICHRETRTP